MYKIVEVKPLENYRLWIKFSDGIEGTVDLSGLVGNSLFAMWEKVESFNTIYLDTKSNTIKWTNAQRTLRPLEELEHLSPATL